MNIVIISESASFPWGMAATSRVKLIAKGLMYLGHSVEYIGLRGAHTKKNGKRKRSDVFEGIRYTYPGLFAVRPDNWFLRRVDDLFGKWNSMLYIYRMIRNKELDIIILYTRKYEAVKTWSKIAQKNNIKILLEICEWPAIYENTKTKKSGLFCEKAPSMVDGVIPISSFITNELKKRNKLPITDSSKIFELPILIEYEKFKLNGSYNKSIGSYLVYTGSSHYYDIAVLILDAMHLLKKDGININLKITGTLRGENKNKIVEIVNNYGIDDLVEFTGYLEEEELIETMRNARALLAPIPDDMQTRARFPTKIGLYLASGTPVLTNPYGEVANYLTDMENVIFMERFTAEALKDKVEYVLSNQEESEKIGEHGRKVALNNFDYKTAFKDFDNFIQQLYQ